MESTRPIRALARGLDALTVLNLRDGATVSEVAQEIRLPRTTVYRILETLCDAGFAFRDEIDDRYRLQQRVRQLSAGFTDEDWINGCAKPCLDALGRELLWPLSIATLSGKAMMVRATTDHSTPLATERFSAGYRLPLLAHAAGRVYLAFCGATERDNLLDSLARSTSEDDEPARTKRGEVLAMLAEVRDQGHAISTRTRRLADEVSLSVPVTVPDGVLAALSIRFGSQAMPLKIAIERFVPRLRQSAGDIAERYSVQRTQLGTEAHPQKAPGVVA